MKIFYLFINYVKGISALLFIGVCSFFNSDALAQSVNINVSITPPYSPFYSDYSGINASKVFLTIQNLTNTTKNIKLTGQLEGDNGVRITTKSNYVPLQPIVLNPNQVKQLNGLALKDIFDVNTLNVYGIDKVKLVQTSRIPEGNYKFCIQAVDMATNQVLSSAAPLGCTTINIAYPDAPVLIAPINAMNLNATQPQSVIFNWINAGFVPVGTQYILQLVEMPLGSTNPDQVLNGTSFPLINKTLNQLSYILSPADLALVVGKKYAWRVKSIDPSGRIVFKNNGISKASMFTYNAPILSLAAPTITSPLANTEFLQQRNDFGGLIQPSVEITWNAPAVPNANLKYQVKIVKVNENSDVATLLKSNAGLVVNQQLGGNAVKIKGKSSLIDPVGTNKKSALGMVPTIEADLEPNANYAIQIVASATNVSGQAVNFSNFGESNVVTFKYKGAPILAPAENNVCNIVGRLVYRYKNENEQPNYSPLNFPPTYVFKKMGAFNTLVLNDAPYPEVAAHGMFANDPTSRPLKSAKIKLVYMRFKTDVKDPKVYKDLVPYDAENQSVTFTQYGTQYKQNEKPDVVVWKGTTDENGNFAISFTNTMKTEVLSELESPSYYSKEIGAFCLTVYEEGYNSSDMIIFPKKGKTIYLPTEVVLVRSMGMELTVKTDKTTDQAMVSSAPVPDYPVQIGVIKNEYPTSVAYPVESNKIAYENMKADLLGKEAMVIDLGKTNTEGKIKFKNLIYGFNKYAQVLEQKFEGNFAYNTETIEVGPDVCNYCPQLGGNYRLSRRNSVFTEAILKKDIIIKPKKPQIYLRAMVLQNGIPTPLVNAQVTIHEFATENTKFPTIKNYLTDKNGYFELRDLEITTEKQGSLRKVIGPLRTITISKDGYLSKLLTSKQLLSFGERYPAQVEQFLSGAGIVAGHVVNENGYPVIANVRIADGAFLKTDDKGFFTFGNVATGANTPIEVVPVVDNYFAETWKANILQGGKTMLSNIGVSDGRIVLKEKLHRMQIKFINESNLPLSGVKVLVGNQTTAYVSAKDGLTKEIKIASPDYEFRIKAEATGFVTYDDYVKVPISKTAKSITITLITAKTIIGFVMDKSTKKPIAGARVYTISGTNEDGQIQNQAFTDANGYYTLSGAINQSMYLDYQTGINLQKPIEVYAVKSGNNAYIRQSQQVTLAMGFGAGAVSRADFALSSIGAKSEIWGMPIEINAAEDVNNAGVMKISGAFVNIPSNGNFKPTIENAQLPFRDLQVTASGMLGNITLNPVPSEILLQKNTFKVTAYNKFNAEVLGSDQFYQYPLLKVTKNSKGLGVLNGFVSSELSSFNYSYNYNGKFLFRRDIVRVPGKPINHAFDVLGAPNAIDNASRFLLSSLYGVSNFKVHDFSATMNTGSYLDKDKYAINAVVNLDIPLVATKTLPVGSIHVKENDISWNDYQGNIELPLEKWMVKGNGLKYELNKGGFQITNGALQTDLPNIPLKNMILMPTSIDLGANTLTGKENLTLGNVTPLHLLGDTKVTLNYDAAAPFDQKPHYRVNLSGSAKKVAYFSNIPGIANDDKIEIELFTAYSDAQHKTVNVSPKVYRFFNVISQNISGIEVNSSSFTLIGNTNLEIPGAANNVTGRFRYYLDAAGKIAQTTEKLQTDIELPGKVKFNGVNFKLSENLFTATGEVLMYKNTIADAISVKGIITKTPSETKMDILKDEQIKMGASNRAMQILNGGSRVNVAKWDLVSFTAKPTGFKVGNKEILEKDKDQIDFIVKGDISNNPASGKVIQLQGIESPFGKFDISFDFDKRALMGALTISDANIPLGPVNIHDGKIDMQIDSNGFIMAGGIYNASLTPLPILKGFKSGIALGFYSGKLPDYMRSNLLNVTLYNQLPDLDDGLKGMYVNVMKSLSKEDLPQLPGPSIKDIPGLGSLVPTIDFFAGVDLRTSMDLNKGLAIKMGGMAKASASFLYQTKLCDIGIAGNADGSVALEYANSNLTGHIGFDIGAKLIYCVGSSNFGVGLLLEKSSSGFKFTPSLK